MFIVFQIDSSVSLLMTANSLSTANETLISGQLSVVTLPVLYAMTQAQESSSKKLEGRQHAQQRFYQTRAVMQTSPSVKSPPHFFMA